MNIREAILKAADSIEQNPNLFFFMSYNQPEPDCGSPACALGWIGYHAGTDNTNCAANARLGLGDNTEIFYERVTEALGGNPKEWFCHSWTNKADICAKGLRLYADKYHPADQTSRVGIPAEVRTIFDLEAA